MALVTKSFPDQDGQVGKIELEVTRYRSAKSNQYQAGSVMFNKNCLFVFSISPCGGHLREIHFFLVYLLLLVFIGCFSHVTARSSN